MPGILASMPELAAAGAEVFQIDDRHVFTDVAILGWLFELEFFFLGRKLFDPRRHQLPESNLAAGRRVHHFVEFHMAFGRRDFPFRGRRVFEHHARGGACFLECYVKIRYGARTVGVLIAVLRIADGLFHPDALPIGIQFVGRDHGKHAADAGSHFRPVGDDHHGSIGFNAQVDAGMERRVIHFGAAQRLLQNRHADDERSGGYKLLQESPAADDINRGHAFTPAACLMAWRIL